MGQLSGLGQLDKPCCQYGYLLVVAMDYMMSCIGQAMKNLGDQTFTVET